MSGDAKTDYKLAQKEIHDLKNKLRQMSGEAPIPFVEGEPPFCSFCGRGINEVKKMIEGPSVFICSECVLKAIRMMSES